MKCTTVRTKLAGYLDDAITGAASVAERVQIGEHLNGCTICRAELESFRKLSVLLSRMPKNVPPADLAVRSKLAAAQSQHTHHWPHRSSHRRSFLGDCGFCPGSSIDGAGHYRACRFERRTAQYPSSCCAAILVGLPASLGA